MNSDNIKDIAIGSAAASSPLWLQDVQTWAGAFVAVGGAVLVLLRLLIAWRDWRNGNKA